MCIWNKKERRNTGKIMMEDERLTGGRERASYSPTEK